MDFVLLSYISISIREVDEKIYNRFKTESQLQGKKLNQALEEAMKYWLERQSSQNKSLEEIKNDQTYLQLKPTLLRNHLNKWVLITDGELKVVANSLEEIADEKIKLSLQDRPSLIFQVGKKRRKVHFNIKKVPR